MYFIEYIRFVLEQEVKGFEKLKQLFTFTVKNIKVLLKRILLKLKKESTYKLVDDINNLKCKETTLYCKSDRKNIIKKPNIFKNTRELFELQGSVPDINILQLTDCKIVSKTSSIISDKYIYNNYLSQMKIFHDFKNPLGQFLNSISSKKVSIYVNNHKTIENIICIHLLNEHSSNYYHLLFEILPKFILISNFLSNDERFSKLEYLLLIDENVPKQFIEVIEYFSNINYKIEYITNHSIINVDTLVFCTDFWNSLDNTMFHSIVKEDFFVDKFAIEVIKEKIEPYHVKPFRKVYFQRKKSQGRYLSNTVELELLLKSQGFEFILPERLSFQEQLKLFSESKIIIGISGAAFSNIIFMQENTHAIIFSPNTVASNYYIFQPMADIAQVNLVHILTKNSFHDSIHANSLVDINEVEELLTLVRDQ